MHQQNVDVEDRTIKSPIAAVIDKSVASASSMTSPDTRSFLIFIDICIFILE